MVSKKSVEKQLKKIKFNYNAWGRGEANELHNILLPEEEVFECVNGVYDGGFALLVGTNVRLLLVDKKPLNFLTVEDLRFDMINEIDYSHRLFGARISVSTGAKNLKFMSYNQARLRKLIGHVQHCMAETKKQQTDHQLDQKQHLEQINQQLQTYLLAQHQQQQKLQEQLEKARKEEGVKAAMPDIELVKPSPELADYLYAQSLLAQHGMQQHDQAPTIPTPQSATDDNNHGLEALPPPRSEQRALPAAEAGLAANSEMVDLYSEGMREIFGRHHGQSSKHESDTTTPSQSQPHQATQQDKSQILDRSTPSLHKPLEINPLRVAYSKLPMALRNRKFGRPSFHAHSHADDERKQMHRPATAHHY